MSISGLEKLDVWNKAMAFAVRVHKEVLPILPSEEKWSLGQQTRRSAQSIPANIAEGFKKTGRADKARFMNIAQGSLEECRYYLILAADLGYGKTKDLDNQLDEIGRMLCSYAAAILSPVF